MSVFATTPIVAADAVFDVGDEIQYHFRHDQIEALIARGEASRTPPKTEKPAYALTGLSYYPHVAGFKFERGDRLNGKLPAQLIRKAVERGRRPTRSPTSARSTRSNRSSTASRRR